MLILLVLWQNLHTKSLFITHDIVAKMQQLLLGYNNNYIVTDNDQLSVVII